MKNYVVLMEGSDDLTEGTRWWKRRAESPEEAVAQLVSDLGREAASYAEAQVVEIEEMVTVRQEMRWTPVSRGSG